MGDMQYQERLYEYAQLNTKGMQRNFDLPHPIALLFTV